MDSEWTQELLAAPQSGNGVDIGGAFCVVQISYQQKSFRFSSLSGAFTVAAGAPTLLKQRQEVELLQLSTRHSNAEAHVNRGFT